jgi:hypothetical protein
MPRGYIGGQSRDCATVWRIPPAHNTREEDAHYENGDECRHEDAILSQGRILMAASDPPLLGCRPNVHPKDLGAVVVVSCIATMTASRPGLDNRAGSPLKTGVAA